MGPTCGQNIKGIKSHPMEKVTNVSSKLNYHLWKLNDLSIPYAKEAIRT
jgi:hypothetical protein